MPAPLRADAVQEADQTALDEVSDARIKAESQATEQSEASPELRNLVEQKAGEDHGENVTLGDGNATISVGIQSARRAPQGRIPRMIGNVFKRKPSSGKSKESTGLALDPELEDNSKIMRTKPTAQRPAASKDVVKMDQSDDGASSTMSQSPESAPSSRIIKLDNAAAENTSITNNEASNETDDPSRRMQRMMVDKAMSSFMDWLDVKLKVKEEEDESPRLSTHRPRLGSGQAPVTAQALAAQELTRKLRAAKINYTSSRILPEKRRSSMERTPPKVTLAKPQSPAFASSATPPPPPRSAPVTRSRGALRLSKSSLDSSSGGLGGRSPSQEADEPTIPSLSSPPRYYAGNSLSSQPLAAPATVYSQETQTNTAPLQEELELSPSLPPPPPGGAGGREARARGVAAPGTESPLPFEEPKKKKKSKRVAAVEEMEEEEKLEDEEDEDEYDRAYMVLESYEEVPARPVRRSGQWKESPGRILPPPPPLPAAPFPALSRPHLPQDPQEAESPVRKERRNAQQIRGAPQHRKGFSLRDTEEPENQQPEAVIQTPEPNVPSYSSYNPPITVGINSIDVFFGDSAPQAPQQPASGTGTGSPSRTTAGIYSIDVVFGDSAPQAPQPPALGTGTGPQSQRRNGPSAAKRGRSKGKAKDDEDEEDGDGNQAPRTKLPKVQEDAVSGAKLACPFFKHNPRKYKNQRPCCGPGWDHVHRIKEHIYRKHSLPKFSCPRCSQPFETQADLQAHARSPDPCEVKEPEILDGITQDQEKKIRSRKKTSGKELTEAEKWTQVYRILFPDVREREIPSPYYNTEDAQTNLSGYEDYLRRELPTLVRRQLEVEVERELSFVEEGMKQKVIEIARNLQLTLFKGYQQLESQEREGLEEASPSAGDVLSTETGGLSSFTTTNTSPSTMTTAGTTPEIPDPLEIFGADPAIPDFDFNFMADIPFPDAQEPPKELNPAFGMNAYVVPDQVNMQPGMELYGGQKLDLPYYGMDGYGHNQDAATGAHFPDHHLEMQAMSVNQAQAYQP
ncbi:hypothetical protein CkaCkLH20_04197 [Colletotrichum karsti]|uniref:C2H2-type domain-containing protein n=1 Tax=Colletotrichum karsti TaxID=1095194 RepID=A0A9P6LJA3_9PEZI|nr:uncharacterized protein CkaCkLH20_04197 [Colletotrichum karsti]KAF9878159.1 hypothetical protein CkaCkLH20_04197 [Colletotrichum karsti]